MADEIKPGRDLDQAVANFVLGHEIIGQRKGQIKERTPGGQVRPLRHYSTDIGAAWEVVQKLGITIIPIENGSWFALVGNAKGFKSPADFMSYLGTADFVKAGAAVGDSAAFTICVAALKAAEKRDLVALAEAATTGPH